MHKHKDVDEKKLRRLHVQQAALETLTFGSKEVVSLCRVHVKFGRAENPESHTVRSKVFQGFHWDGVIFVRHANNTSKCVCFWVFFKT